MSPSDAQTIAKNQQNSAIAGGGLHTAQLLARPPLMERSGAQGVKRVKLEEHYRRAQKVASETVPVTWFRGLLMTLLRWGLSAIGLYKRGNRNALNLQLVKQDLFFDVLPAGLSKFRILHISDLHLPARFPDLAKKIATLVKDVEVDLCVLTGDYRWGYYGNDDHLPKQLPGILKTIHTRYGTVACLGNHDKLETGALLEKMQIPVLYNEGFSITHNDSSLWVCGIDDPHIFNVDHIDQAVEDAPKDAFILMLAHSPERIAEAEEAGVSLYLTGHTHGGQIRLPLIGALSKNAACTQEQVAGPWQHKTMQGYTSCGIGTTDLPVRYLCLPEAVIITLHQKASN